MVLQGDLHCRVSVRPPAFGWLKTETKGNQPFCGSPTFETKHEQSREDFKRVILEPTLVTASWFWHKRGHSISLVFDGGFLSRNNSFLSRFSGSQLGCLVLAVTLGSVLQQGISLKEEKESQKKPTRKQQRENTTDTEMKRKETKGRQKEAKRKPKRNEKAVKRKPIPAKGKRKETNRKPEGTKGNQKGDQKETHKFWDSNLYEHTHAHTHTQVGDRST